MPTKSQHKDRKLITSRSTAKANRNTADCQDRVHGSLAIHDLQQVPHVLIPESLSAECRPLSLRGHTLFIPRLKSGDKIGIPVDWEMINSGRTAPAPSGWKLAAQHIRSHLI